MPAFGDPPLFLARRSVRWRCWTQGRGPLPVQALGSTSVAEGYLYGWYIYRRRSVFGRPGLSTVNNQQ
jgi:hypothetical protein